MQEKKVWETAPMLLGGPDVGDRMKYTGGGPQSRQCTCWGGFRLPDGSKDCREHPDPTRECREGDGQLVLAGGRRFQREHVMPAATRSEPRPANSRSPVSDPPHMNPPFDELRESHSSLNLTLTGVPSLLDSCGPLTVLVEMLISQV